MISLLNLLVYEAFFYSPNLFQIGHCFNPLTGFLMLFDILFLLTVQCTPRLCSANWCGQASNGALCTDSARSIWRPSATCAWSG